MIRALARWILSDELTDQYLLGWGDGVDQQRLDPISTQHHTTYDSENEMFVRF